MDNATYWRQLPRVLIIGVRKGGTRALLEMLNLHPRIAMVPVEVHFFDKVANYERGLDWYRSHMPLSTDDQLTVEKSPSYYVTPEVPERVWSMSALTQLVLIVRDPVTRLLSDFAQIEASRVAQGLAQRRFQVSHVIAAINTPRSSTASKALGCRVRRSPFCTRNNDTETRHNDKERSKRHLAACSITPASIRASPSLSTRSLPSDCWQCSPLTLPLD